MWKNTKPSLGPHRSHRHRPKIKRPLVIGLSIKRPLFEISNPFNTETTAFQFHHRYFPLLSFFPESQCETFINVDQTPTQSVSYFFCNTEFAPMSPLRSSSIRRSTPSINQLASIQLLRFNHFHVPLPSSLSPLTASSFVPNKPQSPAFGSFLKWISSVAVGSGLGLLYWSSSSSISDDFNSAFFNKSFLSLSDWSTATDEATVDGRRSSSLFQKLSLPGSSPKFLFGGKLLLIELYPQLFALDGFWFC